MFQVFPALSFVKIWKILLNKIRETIFQDEGAKLETSNVYHPHILMDIQSHMDSQNFFDDFLNYWWWKCMKVSFVHQYQKLSYVRLL